MVPTSRSHNFIGNNDNPVELDFNFNMFQTCSNTALSMIPHVMGHVVNWLPTWRFTPVSTILKWDISPVKGRASRIKYGLVRLYMLYPLVN